MDSYSISEGQNLTGDYYDRKQQQEQFEESQNVEKQKVEIQQRQLEIQQQRQDTNQMLVVGGLSVAGVLVLAIVAYLIIKAFKKEPKLHKKS